MNKLVLISATLMAAFALAQQQSPIEQYKSTYGKAKRTCYESDFLLCKRDLLNDASNKAVRTARKICEEQTLKAEIMATQGGCNPEAPDMHDDMNLPTHVECWAEVVYNCR